MTNEILEQFRAKHPSLGLIADHRKLSKALGDLNLIDSYRNKANDRVRNFNNYVNDSDDEIRPSDLYRISYT